MKKIILFLFLIVTNITYSQNYKITYTKSSNGNLIENQDAILIFTNNDKTLISSEKIINHKSEFPFEQTFINRNNNFLISATKFNLLNLAIFGAPTIVP